MKPTLEFDTAVDTGNTVAKMVGRLQLGDGSHTVRLFLLPDGLHIGLLKSAESFVHWIDSYQFEYSVTREDEEGEGK